MVDLTPKEQLFVQEYVVNGFNGKRAYMKAYESTDENLSAVEAHKLLKKQKIQDALEIEEGGFRQLARQHGLNREAVMKRLWDLIYGTTKIIDKKGNVYETPYDGKTINSALVTLARLTGDFSPEQKKVTLSDQSSVDITKLTPEEREAYKTKILSEL